MTDLGLDKHLSPTRSNGLSAMLKRIYEVAEQEAA
jgi:cysteine desulfuration protein SufE